MRTMKLFLCIFVTILCTSKPSVSLYPHCFHYFILFSLFFFFSSFISYSRFLLSLLNSSFHFTWLSSYYYHLILYFSQSLLLFFRISNFLSWSFFTFIFCSSHSACGADIVSNTYDAQTSTFI